MNLQDMFSNLLDEIQASSSLCPKCGEAAKGLQDQAFIKQTGRCISCDHLEGDLEVNN